MDTTAKMVALYADLFKMWVAMTLDHAAQAFKREPNGDNRHHAELLAAARAHQEISRLTPGEIWRVTGGGSIAMNQVVPLFADETAVSRALGDDDDEYK